MLKKILLGCLSLMLFIAIVGAANWHSHLKPYGSKSPVSFSSSDGIVLRGVLFRPPGVGPHPAIVILHGSGQASGTPPFVTAHANAFARKGIAVLSYDKRGSGASGGDFETSTYKDFIEDALAALRMLDNHPDIDPTRLAVFGSSESGWFTPEIAHRNSSVRFIINRSGPPTSWIETNLWEIRHELKAAGLRDDREIDAFLELRKDIWDYYRAAASAENELQSVRALLEERIAGIDQRWLRATGMAVASYEQAKFERYVADIFYDPLPYLEALDVPMFALLAGADQNVPSAQAEQMLKSLKQDSGKDIEITIFSGYKHGMAKWYNVFWMGYPPSYLNSIGDWAGEKFRESAS